MRLWSAQAVESFDFGTFTPVTSSERLPTRCLLKIFRRFCIQMMRAWEGKQLRLAQQFFFVSCSLQHIVKIQASRNRPLAELHRTRHPDERHASRHRGGGADALLIDEHGLEWDAAWHVTQHTLAYTNHTLLPEALEQWPRGLFGFLLPAAS